MNSVNITNLEINDIYSTLRQSPLFAQLNDEQITQACDNSKVIYVKEHTRLFNRGDKVHCFTL